MSAILRFYDGKNYELVSENISQSIISHSFTNGLNGSSSGEIVLEVGTELFLHNLKENSHFITFGIEGYDSLFGGLIDDAFVNEGECHILFSGFNEYLDKIRAISSYKNGQLTENVVVGEDDRTWEKTLLSDTPEGLLYEAFINLEERMNAEGYNRFWEWDGIFEHIQAVDTNTWGKSYIINSGEYPTMKSIFDEIVGDQDCHRLDVRIDTEDNKFKWVLHFTTETVFYEINEETDNIYNINFEYNGLKSRTNSLAKGQTVDNESVLSKIPFDNTVAFSDYVAEETTNKSTSNAGAINYSNIDSIKKLVGQLSFSTQEPYYNVSNVVSINVSPAEYYSIIVSEVRLEDDDFTITGNIIDSQSSMNKIKVQKPRTVISEEIGVPIAQNNRNARKSVFGEKRTTGWRSL